MAHQSGGCEAQLSDFSLLLKEASERKMLDFEAFFTACVGSWKTERIYHSTQTGEVERSYTEYQVEALTEAAKQQILQVAQSIDTKGGIQVDLAQVNENSNCCPGFAIAFDTVSEKGERVSMKLKALFVPDSCVLSTAAIEMPALPLVAQVAPDSTPELIQGFYLRDEGYSEAGTIAGRFTYQPIRQTLEMTTHYRRSVAVDQMRIVSPELRLRTIVTYERPTTGEPPTVITLVGFGVEYKQLAEGVA